MDKTSLIGLSLRSSIPGDGGFVCKMSWSPDGRFLAAGYQTDKVRIWDKDGEEPGEHLQHEKLVSSVAWSPNGELLASGSADNKIRIWNWVTSHVLKELIGHEDFIRDLAWSPDGKTLASVSKDGTIRLWDTTTGKIKISSKCSFWVLCVAWSPNGEILATGDGGSKIRLWNPINMQNNRLLIGHRSWVDDIVWSKDGEKIVSVSGDSTIKIWDVKTARLKNTIEGHTKKIRSVSLSSDGSLLATQADDGKLKIWSCSSWDLVADISTGVGDEGWPPGIAFNPISPTLASLGKENHEICVWNLDVAKLLNNEKAIIPQHKYVTAKIVLVGNTGVGKTGLGWRLAHNDFKDHSSTHGQQFWVIEELGKTRDDGTKCEAVLWDLAGQPVYRLIHSIFLDKVDASLVLFDPTNRQDPLKGAQFWLEQLKGKKQLPPSLLVGARMDRGGSTVSQEYLEQFCQQYGISGGYIATSAKTGEGLNELLQQIKSQIPWDEMTATVTTVTFKRIKDYVLALKEKTDRKGVLVQPAQLRQQLQETDPNWQFTDAEMMTAVGHLETHGYVTILKSSFGDSHILLTPDLLVDLASSIVVMADKHPRELGAISEGELLQGNYTFDELEGLEKAEKQVLFDAAMLRFLEHNVCFRETLDNDTLLIFPGLIKQKRPLEDDFPATDDVSYVVRGRVENIYAMLVVLLGYTPSFIRINHWQKQAQYAMGENEICGFRMIEDREDEIEFILYYSNQMPVYGREKFQELFEQFLHKRDVQVTRFPPVICSNGHLLERATVVGRIKEKKTFAFCAECGDRVNLPDLERSDIGTDSSTWIQREEATARLRSTYEQHLSRIKGYRRGWATPRCYLSFAPEQENYAQKLISDLQEAGIYVIEEAAQVDSDDYVIVLDTPKYQRLFNQPTQAFKADKNLVKARFGTRKLISLNLDDSKGTTKTHNFSNYKTGDFCDATHYPVNLFNLVLNLYSIPLDHASFITLRRSLHQQWEQTLSQLPREEIKPEKRTLKVFVSYAHEDKNIKDKFIKMLSGMQRRGVIAAWQDDLIAPGDEWYPAIQTAMNECDLALLLVSANFIDSNFINDEEVPKLLQRRQDEGMRIIPIIIRPCLWDSEPVLKDLQALPKGGKPVTTFPNENSERDQAWTDIAKAIEKFAKDLRADYS